MLGFLIFLYVPSVYPSRKIARNEKKIIRSGTNFFFVKGYFFQDFDTKKTFMGLKS